MQVIGVSCTPIWYMFVDETVLIWGVYFKVEVSCGIVVTEGTGDRQVFRTCVEYHSDRLTYRRANVDCANIHGIISTLQGHLETQIVFKIVKSNSIDINVQTSMRINLC